MNYPLLKAVEKNNYKIVFTDLFDTLLHRNKHPNHVLKLWAKYLVRELSLKVTPNQLYKIRKASLKYLAKKKRVDALEVNYKDLQIELFKRLKNTAILASEVDENQFIRFFEKADYTAEVSLQRINTELHTQLKELSENGTRIFVLTDFNLSKEIVLKILDYHDLASLFEEVYVSSDIRKSKHIGDLYPHVVSANYLNVDEIIMVGDNERSDVVNAGKYNINAVHIPNKGIRFKNKLQLFGSEKKDFIKACNNLVKACKKSDYVFSEYLIHYYFFVKRIYTHAKANKIEHIFFLAREGLFLKNIFDDYQDLHAFSKEHQIKTHYLKISRQASVQISLKPIEEEEFTVIRKNNTNLSLNQFLDNFNAPSTIQNEISKDLGVNLEDVVSNFFTSSFFNDLKENEIFKKFYESNRIAQKEAFDNYVKSFNADVENKGMTLVDIGWGGTMQESLFKYFKKKVPITGLYLGLKEIYNIEEDTKRYGLNFTVYPNASFDDEILLANGQLYEQLAAAPHGCTIGYSNNLENPTVEFHEEEEKYVYDNYVGDIQRFMREQIQVLYKDLNTIVYTPEIAQDYLVRLAMKTGIFMNKSKLKFIHQISKGFFQNIGDNKVGIDYKAKSLPFTKKELIVALLLNPEKMFRYMVKVKPRMYEKGWYPVSFVVNIYYYYLVAHRSLKKRYLSKGII